MGRLFHFTVTGGAPSLVTRNRLPMPLLDDLTGAMVEKGPRTAPGKLHAR
jgi:hypothetical protein